MADARWSGMVGNQAGLKQKRFYMSQEQKAKWEVIAQFQALTLHVSEGGAVKVTNVGANGREYIVAMMPIGSMLNMIQAFDFIKENEQTLESRRDISKKAKRDKYEQEKLVKQVEREAAKAVDTLQKLNLTKEQLEAIFNKNKAG